MPVKEREQTRHFQTIKALMIIQMAVTIVSLPVGIVVSMARAGEFLLDAAVTQWAVFTGYCAITITLAGIAEFIKHLKNMRTIDR